jgi:hypothetical protein
LADIYARFWEIPLTASVVALVWVRPDIHQTLQRIEWPVLLFFAARKRRNIRLQLPSGAGRGLPVMVAACVVASILYALFL